MKVISKYSFLQYLQILMGNLFCTLAYTTINVPKGIVNGGLTSLSMVLSRITGMPVWVILDVCMFLLLMGCLFFLGKKYFYHSLISAVCYSAFFTGFTATLPELACPLPIAMVLSAVAVGIGCFFCIRAQASTLGFDVIAMILHKKNPKIGIARSMFVCNALVILMGWMTYGFLAIAAGLAGAGLQAFTLGRLLKRWPRQSSEEDETLKRKELI